MNSLEMEDEKRSSYFVDVVFSHDGLFKLFGVGFWCFRVNMGF